MSHTMFHLIQNRGSRSPAQARHRARARAALPTSGPRYPLPTAHAPNPRMCRLCPLTPGPAGGFEQRVAGQGQGQRRQIQGHGTLPPCATLTPCVQVRHLHPQTPGSAGWGSGASRGKGKGRAADMGKWRMTFFLREHHGNGALSSATGPRSEGQVSTF